MRPMITFLTSTELQKALKNDLSDSDMDKLQALRDEVKEDFRQHVEALSEMENLYGEQWRSRDIRVWFVDDNGSNTISSPILINEETKDDALFATFHALAKNLIRKNYPDSELIEDDDNFDAVAGLLARESLRAVMEDVRFHDMMDALQTGAEDTAVWDMMDEYADKWDTDKSLYSWLETQ